ncbi:MAG: hypothetical protein M3P45_09495, partial [Acidobacteriota bacterium]|nr:hypothetical protein [Acidobacteriota bacterium]
KILTFGRCKYLTKTGRRCRSQIVYPDGRYCRQHILTQESKDDFELLLTDQALRFRHTRGIHNSLQRLYGLLAAGEISPRRAATLAYISNLLIRHLPDALESDSRACRCTGFPHARHEVYPAPAPQTIATENIATETKSAPHKPNDNRDHHRNANHNGAAASDLHAPSAEFTTSPESTNVN